MSRELLINAFVFANFLIIDVAIAVMFLTVYATSAFGIFAVLMAAIVHASIMTLIIGVAVTWVVMHSSELITLKSELERLKESDAAAVEKINDMITERSELEVGTTEILDSNYEFMNAISKRVEELEAGLVAMHNSTVANFEMCNAKFDYIASELDLLDEDIERDNIH